MSHSLIIIAIIRHINHILAIQITSISLYFYSITNFDNRAVFWRHESSQLFSVTDFLKQLFFHKVSMLFVILRDVMLFFCDSVDFFAHRLLCDASLCQLSTVDLWYREEYLIVDTHGLQRYEKQGQNPSILTSCISYEQTEL